MLTRKIPWNGIVALAVVVLVAACSRIPSGEARDRKALLAGLELGQVDNPMLTLVGESSTAGRENRGAPLWGRDVEVSRRYEVDGDPNEGCMAAMSHFFDHGADALNIECEPLNEFDDFLRVSGVIYCELFPVGFSARAKPTEGGVGSSLTVELHAPYPGEESNPAIPITVDPIDCQGV